MVTATKCCECGAALLKWYSLYWARPLELRLFGLGFKGSTGHSSFCGLRPQVVVFWHLRSGRCATATTIGPSGFATASLTKTPCQSSALTFLASTGHASSPKERPVRLGSSLMGPALYRKGCHPRSVELPEDLLWYSLLPLGRGRPHRAGSLSDDSEVLHIASYAS